MLKPASVWALAAVVNAAAAAPPHPRLWIARADLARLRTAAADGTVGPLGFAPAEAFATLRKRADGYLEEAAFTYRISMPGQAGGVP